MQDGLRLCFQRGQQRHWLKPGLSILIECTTWMLLTGREDVAVGWLVCCALGAHRVEKKPLCEGASLWSCPLYWLELGHRGWLTFSPLDGVEIGLKPPQIIEQQL